MDDFILSDIIIYFRDLLIPGRPDLSTETKDTGHFLAYSSNLAEMCYSFEKIQCYCHFVESIIRKAGPWHGKL